MKKNLISVDNLNKEFPGKIICRNASFGISEGQKIGLIGVNGCGKSTFLRLLSGLEPIDSGQIIFRKDTTIGFLPQEPDINPEISIYEHIYYSDNFKFKLLRKYHRLLSALETNPSPELQKAYQKIQTEMEAHNVWEIEIQAQSFLSKLGFQKFDEKIGILSGGQKRRIDLARVLMDRPDILLLDEPTNHLDIDTIEWFQDYLREYPGTIIFVTHDRYFLDAVSNCIMDMEAGKIKFYFGNYSYYLKRKDLEMQDLERKETRRSAQLKKELKWLQRGAKARTSKPKNHLDRVKELLDKSYLTTENELEISFISKRLGKTILEIKNISKSYDDNQLIKNFSYNFQKMDRIGIIGPNGCGKTTLLKMITNEIDPDTGKIKLGQNTHFSYFQQNIEIEDENLSVLQFIKEQAEQIRTKDGTLHSATEILKRFLFDGKKQQQKINSLSGGEKKRLFLLRSLMFGSNFIILDEPTNDLDIKTLEILEDYLDAFRGCMLIVSHDRYFLDRIVDYLFIFEDDKIIKFPGNYSDYLLVKRYRSEQNTDEISNRKNRRKDAAKGLNFNEKRELAELEKQLLNLEKAKQHLESRIENEAGKLSPKDFAQISEELQKIETEYDQISERWLELEEKKV